MKKKFEILAEKFKSMGHPTRIEILHLLSTCGKPRLTVKNIYETLGKDQPSISRHLNILRKNGSLLRETDSGGTFYSLSKDYYIECVRRSFV